MSTPKSKSTNGAAKHASKKTAGSAAPADEIVDPVATGSQAEYGLFAPEAEAIAQAEVLPMRADLHLALLNVQTGVPAVLAEQARLSKLPETDVEAIAALPSLVLATIYADTQIDRSAPPSELQDLMARGRVLRKLLLTTAEGLAEAGVLSKSVVAGIRAGKGKLDSARDCIALSAVFTKDAATIRGKHPISAKQVQEAGEVGAKLVALLKTKRARTAPAAKLPAAEMRDRLWTLVVQRYDALWRAGAYLFGRDGVEAKVPLLQANRGGRAKKPAKAVTAPVAGADTG